MAVTGGIKCIKVLLFIFNLLFFLAGLALIIGGVVINFKFKDYITVLGPQFSIAPYVIIGVGVVIFIVAFFGCCGAYKENVCMVSTFAALMVMLLILEFSVAITAVVLRNKVTNVVNDALKDALHAYNSTKVYTAAFDLLQRQFDCCGIKNYNDWNEVNEFKKGYLPVSCCRNISHTQWNSTSADKCSAQSPYLRSKGCLQGFVDYCQKNVAILAGIALGICGIEIAGIILACCLASAIKKQNYDKL